MGRKEAILDGAEGIYIYGTDAGGNIAAGKLMELTLQSHSSVIVYGKRPDFYSYVQSVVPKWVATFTPDMLSKESAYPWISDLSPAAIRAMKNTFETSGFGRDLVYIKGNTKGKPKYMRPGIAQCFYQISTTGGKNKKIYAESLFTGLLKELISRDGVRDVAVFYEAPIRPHTVTALDTLYDAIEEEVCLIGMYEGDGSGYEKGEHGLTCTNGIFYYKHNGKEKKVAI